MINKIKLSLDNENGDPMVEMVIAIFVSLAVVSSLIFFGGAFLSHISQCKASVSSLN